MDDMKTLENDVEDLTWCEQSYQNNFSGYIGDDSVDDEMLWFRICQYFDNSEEDMNEFVKEFIEV